MKWLTVMLLGTLMMGCATSPVVTSKQLSLHKYEIRVEADYTEAGFIFSELAGKLCQCQGAVPWKFFPNVKLGSGRKAIVVGTVECMDGFWKKKGAGLLAIDKDKERDHYECTRDADIAIKLKGSSSSRMFDVYYRHLYDQTGWAREFERCMGAKGYVYVEKKEYDRAKKEFEEILDGLRRK